MNQPLIPGAAGVPPIEVGVPPEEKPIVMPLAVDPLPTVPPEADDPATMVAG